MLYYYVLMLDDGTPYECIFVSEHDAIEEGYKMGMINVYVYKVYVAT